MTMTRQEMFNKAYLGVMRQGALCKDENNMCAYSSNGRHCGIGHLLNNEQLRLIALRPKLNTTPVPGLIEAEVLPRDFDTEFGFDLQLAHDGAQNLADFETNMRTLADSYNLTIPPLQPIEALS